MENNVKLGKTISIKSRRIEISIRLQINTNVFMLKTYAFRELKELGTKISHVTAGRKTGTFVFRLLICAAK